MSSRDPIARVNWIGIDPSLQRFPIFIAIDPPTRADGAEEMWRCSASIEPLFASPISAAGGDAFQALCLAVRLVVDVLQSYVEKGGRITYDGESDVPLDAYIAKVRAA